MSTIVGLLLYSLDQNRSFELDSNKKLRKKVVLKPKREAPKEENITAKRKVNSDVKHVEKEEVTSTSSELLPKISKNDKNKGISKFWNKVSEWF